MFAPLHRARPWPNKVSLLPAFKTLLMTARVWSDAKIRALRVIGSRLPVASEAGGEGARSLGLLFFLSSLPPLAFVIILFVFFSLGVVR